MDNYSYNQTGLSEPPKRRPVFKILAGLALAILLFVAGVVVGNRSQTTSNHDSKAIDYSSVDQLYGLLKRDFDGTLKSQSILDGIKHGLVSATGDPYTTYFNADEAKTFEEELSGSFSGIGAELGSDEQGRIVIVAPLSGSPAAKAGLKSHDVVAAVDGKSTNGQSIDSIVTQIRGSEGSKVKLTIIRGSGAAFEVSITRQKIKVPSVKAQVDGRIGYLKVSQFSADTSKLAEKAIKNFKAKGVKAVALDLRGDPGGFLEEAVQLSSFWLNKDQVVVQERRGGQVTDTQKATGNNLLKGLPTVVLIDGGSASASEITAGALRDNGVAVLVGTKSFGKGSVQKVDCLGITSLSGSCDGAELKVTVARWYTPKGVNIDKQGIAPDIKVGISEADFKAGRDPQKDKAYSILQQKIH